MTLSQRIHGQIALVAALVWGLGITNWVLEADKAGAWIAAMGGMAAIWIAVFLMERGRSFSRYTDSERRYFRMSVMVGGLMLAGSLSVSLAETLGIADGPIVQRGLGIGIGLVLILIGNVMPKVLGRRGEGSCPSERSESMKRFAGWALVIAGLVYVAAWFVLPVPLAGGVATAATALALGLIIARGAGFLVSRRGSAQPPVT
ncbi:hypothetical protein [uncultured Brevundimonas sp.]|uniref:hypothetical protein n=1 Tax=uncultured Brevundimonas sp. TaxID=213418 RepID=UPI0030EE3287|tara:strand:- start:1246 stop:1854 length:609 start_codon:yes stop_codon:yes gene_type:complete